MGFKGKVYVPDGASQPSLPTHGAALASSIFTRITTYYATESERNTATAVPSQMSADEKLGMRCWVDERKGFCFWNGSAWVWEPQNNILLDARRLSAADAAGTSPIDIILMPSVTLPPGNRRVRITASSVVEALTGSCAPRAYVEGPGLATTEMYLQTYLPAISVQATVSREWEVTVSGSVAWNLRGINAGAGANVRFQGSFLQIVDLGPA